MYRPKVPTSDTAIEGAVQRWCIDDMSTRIHEQAVQLGSTAEFGTALQVSLPAVLKLARAVANPDQLLAIRSQVGVSSRRSNGQRLMSLLDVQSDRFDLVSGPRDTLTLEIGQKPRQLAVTEDVTIGNKLDRNGNGAAELWPMGTAFVHDVAQRRQIKLGAWRDRALGTRLNLLLARIAGTEICNYALDTGMPAIIIQSFAERDRVYLRDTTTADRSNPDMLAPVTAPIRSVADLVNLANFHAHVFGEEVPYDTTFIQALLRNRHSMRRKRASD